MRTRTWYISIAFLTALTAVSPGQVSNPASAPNVPAQARTEPGMPTMTSPQVAPVEPLLARLQQLSGDTLLDLARLRVDKWRTESAIKQQTQANVEAVQRNLASGLPSLVEQVRTAPNSVAPNLKLYRNLNVLYDVLASVAEYAGAFGPKQDFDPLARDVGQLDELRKTFADRLEKLATAQEAELVRLQNVIRAQAAQTAAAPPKHIVVDENPPAPKKKAAPRKPASKPAPQPSTPQ